MKVLMFSGSSRQESLNQKLLLAAEKELYQMGVEVTVVSLRDYAMPIYDGDLEARVGPPDTAFQLQNLMADHDTLVIASPEHNGSVSALLKNTLDWLSRAPSFKGAKPFAGKKALLLSASPGAMGGIQGLEHLRQILNRFGVVVLPKVVAVPNAGTAFAGSDLVDKTALRELLANLVALSVN